MRSVCSLRSFAKPLEEDCPMLCQTAFSFVGLRGLLISQNKIILYSFLSVWFPIRKLENSLNIGALLHSSHRPDINFLIHTLNLHGTLNQPNAVKVSAFEVLTADIPILLCHRSFPQTDLRRGKRYICRRNRQLKKAEQTGVRQHRQF